MEDDEWAQTVNEILYCLKLEKRLIGGAIAEFLSFQKS
jgi:hypothetical protein